MVSVTLLNTGSCHTWGKLAVKTWSWRKKAFPAIAVLIEHPNLGVMLFDTGYSSAFFSATRSFPYRLYRWITPVHHHNSEALTQQLQAREIPPKQVRYIFISHFHADHLCGLNDFPNAELICSQSAADNMKNLSGFSALTKGFLPALLPENFCSRLRLLNENRQNDPAIPNSPFAWGTDLFGDRSLIAIALPGHAKGQMGLLIDQKLFLIADAAWSLDALKHLHPPHTLAHLLHHSKTEYLKTFHKLHQLTKSHPHIQLIPSHCCSVLSPEI